MELSFRKKKYQSIDSCIILRMLIGDIPEQRQSVRSLLLNGSNYYVDEVAIMECVHVLTKLHATRTKIASDLQLFLSNPMIVYDESLFEPVFSHYVKHPSLSFDDCVLDAKIKQKGHEPLWTFDKKFANQSSSACLLAKGSA